MKFDVTALASGNVQVVMSRELAGMLADVLDGQGRENRLERPVFALGEKLSRLVRPARWFGPNRAQPQCAAHAA